MEQKRGFRLTKVTDPKLVKPPLKSNRSFADRGQPP